MSGEGLMVQFPIRPPDGADWTIEPVALDGGLVGLVIGFQLDGEPITLALRMDRPESRQLAHAILAAGGDATERTFTGGSGGSIG